VNVESLAPDICEGRPLEPEYVPKYTETPLLSEDSFKFEAMLLNGLEGLAL
jgi:hypothetical protein